MTAWQQRDHLSFALIEGNVMTAYSLAAGDVNKIMREENIMSAKEVKCEGNR